MKKIQDVSRENVAYRNLEKVTIQLYNGEQIQVKLWDNELLPAGMDFVVTYRDDKGLGRELK